MRFFRTKSPNTPRLKCVPGGQNVLIPICILLILFNSCNYCTNIQYNSKLAIPSDKPTKETKAKIETHPVMM